MGAMRYIVATLGGVLIFAGVLMIAFLVSLFTLFLGFDPWTINLGPVTLWASPAFLAGIPLGLLAAVHSFRSTLKRSANGDNRFKVNQYP